MSNRSAHQDTFAREHLPPPQQWPDLRFTTPELQYPPRLNCARVLLDQALDEGHADHPAVLSATTQWSYAQLRDRVDRIAHVLVRNLGVVPGNRILLRAGNSPMLVAAWLAVMKVGAIAVTTVPMLRARELAYMARKARIEFALCEAPLVEDLRVAAVDSGHLARILTWGGGELEALMERHPLPFEPIDTAADDVCLLAFTSGTTGNAKVTMHFHRDVLAMADVVGRHLLHTETDDIYVGSPPLGFTFGLGALLVFPLRFRAATVMLEKASPEALLQAVARFRATALFTAPTMYRKLAQMTPGFDLSSLRLAVSAGEHLSRHTSDAWHEATGLRLTDGIGSTEMIHIFIGASGADIRPGATGVPLPGYEACILDAQDRPLPRGSTGRLAVRGPTGCRYLDDPERQRQSVVNGWNLTGDRYYLDEDGYYWFQSRTDDLIVSSGYNISGAEIEEALGTHPQVLECAVVAAPDAERGSIAKAFVVLREPTTSAEATVRALQDHVKACIAPYKYPRSVELVDALPRTPTGKIQRSALRARAASVAGSGESGSVSSPGR
ncbi:MAG TPA: AMP-binding protein [Steroidobacteraceae bacterium]|nr:AMP-binding protein [Steroidobacteraceae bacterium]